MKKIWLLCALLFTTPLMATTFIVPDDAELVDKSAAIAAGEIVGARAVEGAGGHIETVYQFRIDRVLKGMVARGMTIDIASPGGMLGSKATHVSASAHFAVGDDVLLFLTPHNGRWATTDLTLGKFRYATTSRGASVVARDSDGIVGWDRTGKVHNERVRRAREFEDFVEKKAQRRQADANYFADASEVIAPPQYEAPRTNAGVASNAAAFPSNTYVTHVYDVAGNTYGVRWPDAAMNAGIYFYKNSGMNMAGTPDGGVSAIQNGLAAWTNDCASNVKIGYSGLRNETQAADALNLIVFNDPNNVIAGSWTGSGTIAITLSSAGDVFSFDGRNDWVGLYDTDIVFQNGYTGSHAAFPTALTHEMGHALGFRHSDQHHTRQRSGSSPNFTYTDLPCDPSVEECSSAAIMTTAVIASYGHNLQTWDRNAAGAVYPGGVCARAVRYDHDGDGKADIFWRNFTTGQNWMYLMNANTLVSSRAINAEGNMNWQIVGVADFNGDRKADILWRNAATGQNWMYLMNANVPTGVGVNTEGNLAWKVAGVGDFNGDGKADILLRNSQTGQNWMYQMNGNVIAASLPVQGESNLAWYVAGVADFNADGKDDIYWRNSQTGQNWMYLMNGNAVTASLSINTEGDPNWEVVGVADFNGDRMADILWRNRSTGWNWLYLMNVNVPRGVMVNAEGNLQWKVANVADFNGDGMADIMWRHAQTGQNWMYLMNGNVIAASVGMQGEGNLAWKVVR